MIRVSNSFKAGSRSGNRSVQKVVFWVVLALTLGLAAPVSAEILEYGDDAEFPAPACPNADTCQAIAQLTGYQIQIGAQKHPFRAARAGKLVAFTVQLPKTTDKQTKFFNDKFGGGPSMRMSVLRPRPRKGTRYRYVLAGQSEAFQLTNYLGSTPQFALRQALTVKRNDVIAVTTETWLPAFSVAADEATMWRASRSAKKCDDPPENTPHTEKGSIKLYGCGYKTARLLYRATVVSDPKPTVSKR